MAESGGHSFHGAAVCAITAVLFVSGSEILLRAFYPQVTMFPRWEPSPAYGVVSPKNATMVHRRPGRWEFQYTINEDRCRGRASVTAVADDTVVVTRAILYMGMGVGDGEEFPPCWHANWTTAIASSTARFAGLGLTQEVRRFYEFAPVFAASSFSSRRKRPRRWPTRRRHPR